MIQGKQCQRCIWYLMDGGCVAFKKIPLEIWQDIHDHRTPYKGDGGVRFKPIGGKD